MIPVKTDVPRRARTIPALRRRKKKMRNLLKEDREAAAAVLRTAVNLVRVFAAAAWPIIPFTAETVFNALHLTPGERTIRSPDKNLLAALEGGRPFETPPPLFRRIDDDEVENLRKEYGV